jgi:hypothetical protein
LGNAAPQASSAREGGCVSIEKAFAINAAPEAIFEAIERDLADAAEHEGETYAVLRREPPRSISLRVTISGMPCWLTYDLEPRDGHTEVAARLQPFGWRYAFFRLITFGLREQGFEFALVQSLANLKEAVEAGSSDA